MRGINPMNREIPIIKLWSTESGYYVYDVYKNKILSVTQNVYIELTKLKKIGISNYLKLQDGSTSYRDTIHLIKKGFFLHHKYLTFLIRGPIMQPS